MWICTSKSFLSIVHKDCAPDELLVRARVPGHIEATFPQAVVTENTSSDYRYRAVLPRADVAQALADQAMKLDYSNFKNTVREKSFASALAAVWGIFARLQPTRPYAGAYDLFKAPRPAAKRTKKAAA